MGTSHHTIQIDANIKTYLTGINDVVKQLQNGLSEGVTKIDLTKGIGKDLSKLIANFQNNYSKINSLIQPGDLLNIGDVKNFQKAGDNIIEVFNTIQRIVNDIGTKELLDAKKLFPNAFDSRITEVQELLKNLQKKTEELSTKQLKAGNLSKEVDNLTAEIARLDQIGSQANLEKLKAELKTAEGQVGTTQTAVESLRKALQDEFKIKWNSEESKEAKDQIEKYESKISELKNKMGTLESKGIQKRGQYGIFEGKGIKEWQKIAKDESASASERKRASNVIQDLQTYNNLNAQLREQLKLLEQIDLYKSKKIIEQDANLSDPKNLEAMAQLAGKSEEVTNALKNQEEATKAVAKAQRELEEAQEAPEKANQLQNTLNRKSEELAKLQGQIELLVNSTNIDTVYQKLSQIEGLKINPEMLKSAEGLQQIMQQLSKLDDASYYKVQQALLAMGASFRQTEGNAEGLRGELNRTGVAFDELMSKTKQMDQLKHRIAYFFGLANSVNLFRRAIQKALNTVKELDAVMTETAVVTDFTVGDMWEKLPEYAYQASNLGASIKDLYSATTLYYQQGLKTEAAMGVGIETMKMARIAGMEASDATTAMTAALRGFNMEVNEMNAQRVNDVYSELAAITAADTEQIATAMSKTASIASSANMEFETTAALLAQIIETTQEAPETAGTAMKTIIARFTEVKELFDEGMLTGKDEEGEEININKIDAALKTVGISLKDFLNGTKGIDDIFLELASKWDGLDLATQRYIATMAAGSRQQSRFIAMMSNYGRTTELVNAANNSAGASQEQFNKTLDSLEVKLQNLQNAWQEFLMGLANSELIKGAVELLTNVIKIINGMVKALSGENGLSKSVITLTLAIAGLSGASTLIKKIFGSKLLNSAIESFDKIKVAAQEAGTTIAANLTNGAQQATDEAYSQGWHWYDRWFAGYRDRRRGSPLSAPPIQGAPGDQTQTQPGQQSQENTQPTEESPPPKSSVAGLRTVGIVSMLTGVLANNAAAALKANDANNAFAAGLETMGSTATIAGSAVTLLAPALKGIIGIGPLIGIVAGLSVAFGALSWAMKDAYNKSLEGRMEAAAKATKQAQEAAEEAKAVYDELLGSRDEYNDLQQTLSELTKGTNEWKQALLEANTQVLELLNTYPELSKYLSRGEYGQLIITDKGLDDLVENQQKAVQRASAAVIGNQLKEIELENERLRTNIDNRLTHLVEIGRSTYQEQAGGPQVEGSYGDPIYEERLYDINEIRKALSADDPDAKLSTLAETFGIDKIEMMQLAQAVSEYDAAIMSNEVKKQTQFEAVLTTSLDSDIVDDEYNEAVVSKIAENAIQNDSYSKRVAELTRQTYTDQVGEDEKRKEYMGTIGLITTGDELKDLQEIYKKLIGTLPEDIAQNKQALAEAIGTARANQEYVNQVSDLQKRMNDLNRVNSSSAKKVAALMSGDASNLTLKELNSIGNLEDYAKDLGYKTSEEMAEDLGYSEKKLSELSEEDLETYRKMRNWKEDELQERIDSGYSITASTQLEIDSKQAEAEMQAVQDKATSELNEKGIDPKQYENFAIGVTQNLSKQTSDMANQDAQAYVKEFNKVLENTTNDIEIANYLSTVDWSDMTEATEAMAYLQQQHIDPSIIKSFWDTATSGAGTYVSTVKEALNLGERLQGKIKNIDDIEGRLEKGEATADDLETLITAGVDTSGYEYTPTGWKATTEQIEEATKALHAFNVESAKGTLERTVQSFEKQGGLLDNYSRYATKNDDDKYVAKKITSSIFATRANSIFNLGIEKIDGENDQQYIARVQAALDSYIESYNNRDEIIALLEKELNMTVASAYSTDEAAFMGLSNEGIRYAMQQEAEKEGLEVEEVIAYSNAIRDVYELEQGVADRIAIDNSKINQGVQEITENYTEWAKAIDSGPGDPKYAISLNKLKDAANKILGSTNKLSKEWLTNAKNMELFRRIAEGDINAIEELRVSAAKEVAVKLGLEEETADEVSNLISDFINSEEYDVLEIGAKLKDTSLYQGLSDLLDSGRITAEQMNEILSTIGWQPDLSFTEVPISQSSGFSQTTKIQTLSPDGQPDVSSITGTGKFSNTGTLVIPSVNSKTSRTKSSLPPLPSIGKSTFSGRGSNIVKDLKDSGGGGGGKDWKNPYDKYYNNVERINEELRTREKIERRYQFLLNKTQTKYSELVKNTEEQIASLERERKMREELLKGRISQMVEVETEYSDLSDYAWYNEEAKTIEIDWEKINALEESLDEELTTRVEEYIGELEKRQKEIEEEEDSLAEIEETLRDIRDQGKDEYFDLEEQIKEALIDSRQKEIDKLSEINETISDTNSRLIDAMQSSIEKYRQDRENKEKEEDLSDKQRRLAYLQQDTSGANDLDIMKLQEELEDEQQDYTDTLIDQKIDELQEQNDKAAEQREKQIELMQAQLDKWSESGEIWREVYRLIDSGMDSDGIKIGSELESILKEGASFEAMSNLEKMKWLEELENNVAKAIQWLMIGNSTESLLSSGVLQNGQTITLTTQDGKQVSGTLQEDGSVITSTGEVYKDVYRGYDGESFYTSENYIDPSQKEKEEETPETEFTPPELTTNDKRGVSAAIYNGNYGWGAGNTRVNRLKEVFGENDIQKNYVDKGVTKGYTGELSDYSYESMKKKFKQYKTGGLADFTGPAWLDGTKSKPEYILNANQTKAFFNLVDVLGSLQNGSLKSTQNNGDNTFDIDINVESIGSDYDVEQLANTIKRLINDDARYRNNNAINLMR